MEKLKIGIVGLHFGRHIVNEEIVGGSGNKYFDLAAVCSQEPEQTNAIASQHGVKAYHDLDALLADKSIPCIGLFSGPVGRAALIRRIIRAGKDVMTTKPFELDPDAALSVLQEAKSIGRIVHLNSPSPTLTGDLKQIDDWRREYDLGRPIGCRSDVWASYREKADGSWYDDPKLCPVPPVFRLGIYLINDLVRFMGPAERAHVFSSRIFTGKPTADNGQLSILFKNGALANIFGSFCVADKEQYKNAMTFNFERGTIYRNAGALPENRPPAIMELVTSHGEQKVVETKTLEIVSGMYQWDVFYRAVKGEKLPDEITPEQVAEGVKIIRAMSRAEQSGNSEAV